MSKDKLIILYSNKIVALEDNLKKGVAFHEESRSRGLIKEYELLIEHLNQMTNDTDIVSLAEIEAERFEWSIKTFPEATPIGSLRKLEEEIKEIEEDINNGVKNPMEYADAMMCLLDSAGRQGISVEDILGAFKEKIAINKNRTWKKNPDNSYSHIKQVAAECEHYDNDTCDCDGFYCEQRLK
jgi:hypothetical protein